MLKALISKKIGANLTVISQKLKAEFPNRILHKMQMEMLSLKSSMLKMKTDKTINHLADKGFNTINYDLTVNATEKSKKQMMVMFTSLQENTVEISSTELRKRNLWK